MIAWKLEIQTKVHMMMSSLNKKEGNVSELVLAGVSLGQIFLPVLLLKVLRSRRIESRRHSHDLLTYTAISDHKDDSKVYKTCSHHLTSS